MDPRWVAISDKMIPETTAKTEIQKTQAHKTFPANLVMIDLLIITLGDRFVYLATFNALDY